MFIGLGFYAVVLGLLMGIPTLRLRADYLAIVTIAAAEIVRLIVRSVRFKGLLRRHRRPQGLRRTSFQQIGIDIGLSPGKTYGFWAFKYSGPRPVGADRRLVVGGDPRHVRVAPDASPWGRVLKAIREDEDAVRSLGKNVYSYKMQASCIGGVIGAFGGMILALGTADRCSPTTTAATSRSSSSPRSSSAASAKVSGSIVGPMLFWGCPRSSTSLLHEIDRRAGSAKSAGSPMIQSSRDRAVPCHVVGLC